MPNISKPDSSPRTGKGGGVQKPHQPPPGNRVNPKDPVEEASHESFPASDPPSFSPSRAGPPRPSGENPDKRSDKH